MRVDIREGERIPDGWFVRGKVHPLGRDAPTLDYWVLRLPFFKFREVEHYDNCMSRQQLAFLSASHGEWFRNGLWRPGRRQHFGFVWMATDDPPHRVTEGLK